MNDERIPILLENLLKIAEGNFDIDMPVSDKQDEIEALSMGVHMLADELKMTTVSKKVAEQNFRRYNQLLETISDGVLEINSKDEITYCNGQAQSILEMTNKELVGKKTSQLFYYKDSKEPISVANIDYGISSILSNATLNGQMIILSFRISKQKKSDHALICFSDITKEYKATAIQRVHEILKHENDRQSIAYRIHEEVGQLLSAVSYQMSKVEKEIVANPMRDKIMEGKELLSESIKEIKKIAEDLSPYSLNYGIKDALENLIKEISNTNKDVNFSLRFINLDEIRFNPVFEGVIYSISESALMIGLNYSNASDIAIVVELKNDYLFIDYYDIGNGLEQRNVSEFQEIQNISDRSVAYDGVFKIDNNYTIGLSMYMCFPISQHLI